jgi:hypothetical protein
MQGGKVELKLSRNCLINYTSVFSSFDRKKILFNGVETETSYTVIVTLSKFFSDASGTPFSKSQADILTYLFINRRRKAG